MRQKKILELGLGGGMIGKLGSSEKEQDQIETNEFIGKIVDQIQQISPPNPVQKRGRKSKKQNEKEILQGYHYSLNELNEDTGNTVHENPRKKNSFDKYAENNTANNIQKYRALSTKEKKIFDQKFTIPKNETQEQYVKTLKTENQKIMIAYGPAGTGKTQFATECGVRHFFMEKYDKLIFTRPSVSVDEDLGFLPGTLEEKMAPWIRPIYDILYQFLTPKEIQTMIEEKIIEIAPLGYMRGRTFKNAWIVADEMQNSTISQMKMLLTRLGENSRLVITGDLEQFDRNYEFNGLDDFLKRFKQKRTLNESAREESDKKSSIVTFEFHREDIQREEVVKEVLDIYGMP
jgi:phosphate starvation-inducible PhoH-like protein